MFFLFPEPALGENEVKIIINKKVNKLAYIKDGVAVRIFPVATGKSAGLTPEGEFKVVRKIVNPYYSKLKIAGGSPRNPLGVRWLGLNACNTPGNTYGIHGTNNPKSIGRYASGGCIRMYNQDVIWLYRNTELHTPVEIINKEWDLEQKPINIVINAEELAVPAGMEPFMVNNRVMVPCRLLAETAGYSVIWNNAERQVILSGGGITVKAAVGRSEITINHEIKYLEVPVTLRNNITYIPLRDLAEALGYTVGWDEKNFTVTLTRPVLSTDTSKQPEEPENSKRTAMPENSKQPAMENREQPPMPENPELPDMPKLPVDPDTGTTETGAPKESNITGKDLTEVTRGE